MGQTGIRSRLAPGLSSWPQPTYASFSKTLKLKPSLYKLTVSSPPIPPNKARHSSLHQITIQLTPESPHKPTTLNNKKRSPWVSCGLNTLAAVTLVSNHSSTLFQAGINISRWRCRRRQAWPASRPLPLYLRPLQLLPLERMRSPSLTITRPGTLHSATTVSVESNAA